MELWNTLKNSHFEIYNTNNLKFELYVVYAEIDGRTRLYNLLVKRYKKSNKGYGPVELSIVNTDADISAHFLDNNGEEDMNHDKIKVNETQENLKANAHENQDIITGRKRNISYTEKRDGPAIQRMWWSSDDGKILGMGKKLQNPDNRTLRLYPSTDKGKTNELLKWLNNKTNETSSKDMISLIMGDFNSVVNPKLDRIDSLEKTKNTSRGKLNSVIYKNYQGCYRICNDQKPGFTHSVKRNRELHPTSRLDYIWINSGSIENLIDTKVFDTELESMSDYNVVISLINTRKWCLKKREVIFIKQLLNANPQKCIPWQQIRGKPARGRESRWYEEIKREITNRGINLYREADINPFNTLFNITHEELKKRQLIITSKDSSHN
ncbi:hypothetical protein Glove_511g24 [Diversispora epigaea]|uniref:Endonuclease/exonuclease/phosphatase domain-containing protein n=1 Tax=Diversispora epigaea TaxID=1348612 RepID=A0A397GL29_9GLOM|nr:hypothetical protein Glove_511g24 [Diversispora epigaea]